MRAFARALLVCGLVACAACGSSSAPETKTKDAKKIKPTNRNRAAAPEATPAKPAVGTATPSTAPPIPENYSYQSGGRRDPFTSPLGSGNPEPRTPPQRGEGLAGMMVQELSVRGVMQGSGGYIAMIQGPDKKSYIVHAGDKLMDGTVKAINAQGLVIVQNVNDPLSIEKQREVRKLLRSLEDAKQ
jgi:Tfp pilus assembly protein PilP